MAEPAMTWEEAVRWLREQPEQQELVRACFFDDPIEEAASRYHESAEWQAVRSFLPAPPARVLDVGAGRGIASYALARDGYRVTALEPDPSSLVGAGCIRRLSESLQGLIEIAEDPAESLPFDDASFDCVHCRQALHHAQDLHRFCAELGRVLRPGGTFITTREHVISSQNDLAEFLDGHPLHRFYQGENAYRLDEYSGAISAAGIKIETILNPFESAINLFPDSVDVVKQRIAARFRFPFPSLVPNALVRYFGDRDNTPGRLYTFVGRRMAG